MTLLVLITTLTAAWAVRTRPDRPLHPAAVVGLVLLAVLLVLVPLAAAAAGVLLAALMSIPAAIVLPDAGPFDARQAAAAMLMDPVTIAAMLGIVTTGALTLRLGRRRPPA